MTKLKPYEKRYDYTVEGQEFVKGFEDFIIDLSLNAYASHTIYIDTEGQDIRAIASCYFRSLPNTYYGIYLPLFDWKVDDIRTVAINAFYFSELEDCISEDQIRKLREEFKEQNGYDKNFYENEDEFLQYFCNDYTEFLINAENEIIDKCVKDYLKESVSYYKEIYDNKYYELLVNETLENDEYF